MMRKYIAATLLMAVAIVPASAGSAEVRDKADGAAKVDAGASNGKKSAKAGGAPFRQGHSAT